jgi:DNA-binding transcriptional MocR family regulator
VTGGPVDLTGRAELWRDPALRLWRAAMTRALADVDPSLRAPPGGDRMLRDQLAERLGVVPERVVITSGVRSAAVALVRPAGRVVVERPTFRGVPQVLSAAGIRVTSVPWERMRDGGDSTVGTVDEVGADSAVGAVVWITAPARNPDGASPEPALLRELVAGGRTVVCNTAYEWFGGPPVLPDGVVRVGTLHKLAGPGAQLGWVVDAPAGRDTALWFAAPPLHWQRAWGYFIRAGGVDVLRDRHAGLAEARANFLTGLGLAVTGAGPHVLVPVAGAEGDAVAAVAAAGVLVSPGAAFAALEPAVRVCLFGLSPSAASRVASVVAGALDAAGAPVRAAAGVPATPG